MRHDGWRRSDDQEPDADRDLDQEPRGAGDLGQGLGAGRVETILSNGSSQPDNFHPRN